MSMTEDEKEKVLNLLRMFKIIDTTVAITNGPVCMCERVAYGRRGCRLARAISAVIYT